jgi:restriction endonuclease S subunit
MAKIYYDNIKVAAALAALFNNINDVIEEINIHEVLKLTSGENLPTHKMIDGNCPVFGGGGATNLTHNISNVNFETLAIGRVGARCGCVFKVPKNSWVTDNALYALSYDKRFNLDYLIYYLSYVDLNQYANRAAQPVISLKRISSINIPLIEYSRQKNFIAIVEQVENGITSFGEEYHVLNNTLKSFDVINQLQYQHTYQLTQIENLKNAILHEAVQGKLVKQEPQEESAGELLTRIKVEKAKLGKKEKPLRLIKTEEIPYKIPENWVWCRLGDLAELKSGNQYTYPKADNGIMFIKVGDMNIEGNEYEIKTSSNFFQTESVKESNLIPKNSIIFPKRGGAIATNKRRLVNNEPILVDSNTMAVIPHKEIYMEYFYQWFNTIDLSKLGSDGVIPQVNNKDLYPILFPLPPFLEQKRIIDELEKQLAKVNKLKEHIISNKKVTELLLKVISQKEFELAEISI